MRSEDGSMLHVIIEDNGKGMSAQEVRKYNDREQVTREGTSGIGLSNVFGRMEMYYGEKAKWNISSIQDVGTVVTLKIPV